MKNQPPYRAPAGPAPKPKPAPEPDALDERALARRDEKRKALDHAAALRRAEDATRQVRLRAGAALVLGLGALALGGPQLTEPGYINRGLVRLVVLGCTLVFYAVFVLVAGTGGAETLDDAPRWVKVGQIGAALVGAAVGLALVLL